jgi:hypothetical protein
VGIKQLFVTTDASVDETVFTVLTTDDRIFTGGVIAGKFSWAELPPLPEDDDETYRTRK